MSRGSIISNRVRQRYEQAAQAVYADKAHDYAVRDELKWKKPTNTALALSSFCLDVHPSRVLELGVGTGRYFPFLIGDTYIGVDVCESMLDHARQRESILRERGFTTVKFIQDEINTFLACSHQN